MFVSLVQSIGTSHQWWSLWISHRHFFGHTPCTDLMDRVSGCAERYPTQVSVKQHIVWLCFCSNNFAFLVHHKSVSVGYLQVTAGTDLLFFKSNKQNRKIREWLCIIWSEWIQALPIADLLPVSMFKFCWRTLPRQKSLVFKHTCSIIKTNWKTLSDVICTKKSTDLVN